MSIEPSRLLVSEPEQILTKALLRAADALEVSVRELSMILGVSPSYIVKLKSGKSVLKAGSKKFELSALFVRVFRSLDAIVGGDESVARDWLRNENTALRGVPLERMKTVSGLVTTVEYLDQRRAPL